MSRVKKIDDDKLLELLRSGKNQKECAEYFGVSSVAICKRIKRLCPPPDMPHFEKLTDKEKRFCIEKAKSKTSTQAVMNSYEVTSRESAKVMGSQLMDKPEVQRSIDELLNYVGLSKDYRLRRLKQIIDSNDLNIAHKGVETSFRLDGSFAPEKHINMNFDIKTEEERLLIQKIATILSEHEIALLGKQDIEEAYVSKNTEGNSQ